VSAPPLDRLVVLAEDEWTRTQAAHERRVDALLAGHLHRARRGEKHPVEDFLFTYYSYRPAQLRRWHPGAGVVLLGNRARERASWRDHAELTIGEPPDAVPAVALDVRAFLARRGEAVTHVRALLEGTEGRPAQLGCFGMHEWAMVYRSEQAEVRHPSWPLRLSPADLADVVDSTPLRCTHYDAYRFFTPPARGLNAVALTRPAMPAHEQGGCLHTNMDLYRVAYKLTPLLPAELVADCFALARRIRELDMRAGPYDLSALGFAAVPVETPAGRAQYVAAQQRFAESAAALRGRLLELLEPWAAQVQPACSSSPAMPATPSEIA
jgi:hypothetical protein